MTGSPVGFVGLGNIGGPMAQRLTAWPHGVVVFDLDDDATAALAAKGAEVAASAAEVAQRCGFIGVMVNTEAQVRAVLEDSDGILAGTGSDAAGTPVVAVHSTISPAGAVGLAAVASGYGVELLDVAVSGGAMGAHAGTLALMVGGDPAAFETIREPLELMATVVKYFGPIGAGTTAKVVRNLITFASYVAVGEASHLAQAAGLDLGALGEVVRHSDSVTGGPGAIMVRDTADVMDSDDPLRPIFEHSAALGLKDLELARELATSLRVASPITEIASVNLRSALGLD